MARLDFFTGDGAVNSPAHIRPANNGSFPLIDAHDVQVGSNPTDADDRLDATLEDIDTAIDNINSEIGTGSSDTSATIKKRLAAAETNIGNKVNTSDIQTTVRAAASASDSKIPSEKAVRSAIDNATVSTTDTPASGSAAAFSAGGAYTELAKKVNTNDIQGTVNTSSNPPSSNAVKTYVDAADALKVNTSDIQTTVRAAASASDSKIPSEKAVRSAIDNATVSTTDTPASGSAAAFSAGGAYTELAKKVNVNDVQSAVNTSTNPVSSNAVKNYVDAADALKVNTSDIQTTVRAAASASDSKIPSEKAVRSAIDSKTITIDSTVTEGSANAVSGGAVYTQLATKQNTLTFDTTPTASSSNPVTSGGVKAALDNKQNTLTYETTPIAGSVNPVTSTGIRNAIDTAAAQNLGAMQAQYAEFVADADAVLDRASSLSNGMVACSNIAAETTVGDTRILLYTGTTNSKYTNGHWYYNSAASNAAPSWTDGGAVGSAPTIDNTLAIDGAAANSKSVGDAIENIVTISNTQPGSNSGNKVWIKETTSEEVQVPTYAEHIAKANKADIATNNESDNGSGTISASKAYAIGDHFYINNTNTSSENYGVSTLYKATAAIASGDAIVVGTNCEASKVADEITSLSNDIDILYNDNIILPILKLKNNITLKNLIISFNNNTLNLSGSYLNDERDTTYYNLFQSPNKFPNGFFPGCEYILNTNIESPLLIQIAAYFENTLSNYSWLVNYTDSVSYLRFTIPSDATGLCIRFRLINNNYNSYINNNYYLCINQCNYIFENNVRYFNESLDLNDIKTPGRYMILGTNHTYNNLPENYNFNYGILQVWAISTSTSAISATIVQKITNLNSTYYNKNKNNTYYRIYFSNMWRKWIGAYNDNYIDSNYLIKNLFTTSISESSTISNIIYNLNNTTIKFSGTSSGVFIRWLYRNISALPKWLISGTRYFIEIKNKNNDNMTLNIAYYKNNDTSDWEWVYRSSKSGYMVWPNDNSITGCAIGFYCLGGKTFTDAEMSIKILNDAPTYYLKDVIDDMKEYNLYNVNIINGGNDNFYVRTNFSDTEDCVYNFGMPVHNYNYTFSFNQIRLIPKTTLLKDTITQYDSSIIYKDMNDEIPAQTINGYFTGSNHGNPNYINIITATEIDIDITFIGTVWTDGNYDYTLVQVLSSTSYVFGSLDSNNQLIVRSPELLTYKNDNSKQIIVNSSSAIQLRRSALHKKWTVTNENGKDIYNGGGGNNIIITEEYDINDQGLGLYYLQENVGNNNNDSYFDEQQPATQLLCHVKNIFKFNRGGSITIYGSIKAYREFIDNKVYGMMSLNFSSKNAGLDNLYVPNSTNYNTITSYIGNTDYLYITNKNNEMHYRYYQLSDNYKAHFLQFLKIGDYDDNVRLAIGKHVAYNSSVANKFYLNMTGERNMQAGDCISWAYGRGPYKYTDNQTVLTYFDLENGYMVSMDWHNNFNGYVNLPDYMCGLKCNIYDKTDSVNLLTEYVDLNGIKINCVSYGYLVLIIK